MTTIVLVRKNNEVVVAGDGQVSMGNTVVKSTASKVRKIEKRDVVAGFAGSTADALTLFERYVHGGGRLTLGTSHADYADFLHWWRFATASFMPAALTDGLLRRLGVEVDPLTEALCSRLDTAYAMIEARLGEATWFAGEAFTLADIVMLFP